MIQTPSFFLFQVMKTLNDLFTRLDRIIMDEMPSLYKVETIGDAYVAAVNLLVPDEEVRRWVEALNSAGIASFFTFVMVWTEGLAISAAEDTWQQKKGDMVALSDALGGVGGVAPFYRV